MEILKYLIQYSSWPIALLIFAWIFKNRIGKISKIKVSDYEISFDNEISSLKKDVRKNSKDQFKLNSIRNLKSNMLSLSDKSPLAVILQAWGIMEQTVIECAKKYSLDEIYNASFAVQYLYDKKIISLDSLNVFFRLSAIKERYLNFEHEIITKNRVLECADLVLEIAGQIKLEASNKKLEAEK